MHERKSGCCPVTDGADAADVTSERGVTLKTPFVLGNKKSRMWKSRPAVQQAGSLRGLSLLDVLNMKTDAMFDYSRASLRRDWTRFCLSAWGPLILFSCAGGG